MSRFFKALERAEHERALRQPPTVAAPAPLAEPTPSRATPDEERPRPSPFSKPPLEAVRPTERLSGVVEGHLVSLLEPTSFAAEQYRALRHMVEQLHRSSNLSVIAVSSADSADGKTTTVINLAGALAQAHDARVLVIDADLRATNLAVQLGFDEGNGPGLVEIILNPALPLEAAVQAHPHLNLSVIAAGRRPAAPYEVLKSPRVAELLAEARRKYDYVIVDTPPLVSVPDGRVIEKSVDGFLIVVAANKTPCRMVEEVLNLLEPAKIVGMVFNGDDRHLSRGAYMSGQRFYPVGGRRRQVASDD